MNNTPGTTQLKPAPLQAASQLNRLQDIVKSAQTLQRFEQSNPIMDELYASRTLLNARYGSVQAVVRLHA